MLPSEMDPDIRGFILHWKYHNRNVHHTPSPVIVSYMDYYDKIEPCTEDYLTRLKEEPEYREWCATYFSIDKEIRGYIKQLPKEGEFYNKYVAVLLHLMGW